MLIRKTAIITGGSRGIGAAITYKPAALGVDVAIVFSGNAEAADNVCRTCITEFGVKARAYLTDYPWGEMTLGELMNVVVN